MNILFISPEAVPFSKTGGLAEVAGYLPQQLATREHVSMFLPLYVSDSLPAVSAPVIDTFSVSLGEKKYPVTIRRLPKKNRLAVFFIEQDLFFARKFLYGNSAGDYPDNFYRYLFFQKAVLLAAVRLNLKADIIHLNDWQTGLIPVLVRYVPEYAPLKKAVFVFTIHNLAYQGTFDSFHFRELGVPDFLFSPEYIEFFGQLNFLKAGIIFADALVTVSPTYAKEILTRAMGFGLDGLLRKHGDKLSGILNGIEGAVWNPKKDPFIAYRYSRRSLKLKQKNKVKLFQKLKIVVDPKWPLVIFIGRLVAQKGIALLLDILPSLLQHDLFFIGLGTGDEDFEEGMKKLVFRFKKKMLFFNHFDERLAHRMEAAGDVILMPSVYEPCGLNQIYSMRYGTVPVVHAVGGLEDTVSDFDPASGKGTGFKFRNMEPAEALVAIQKALVLFQEKPIWETIQKNGMQTDFSWKRSAGEYLLLYKKLLSQEIPHG